MPGLRERLSRPAALVGYVGFYGALALTFLALLLKGLGTWWSITGYVVFGLAVIAGVAVNWRGAVDLFRTRKAAAGMSVALAVTAGR